MYAVIMCGGSGTRFWPLSRKAMPKQFLDITGNGAMVVETCDRIAPLVPDERILLVLGKDHLATAQSLFGERRVRLLAEPAGRNTAAAMGLGALVARHMGCTEPVLFLPADHHIALPEPFLAALRRASEQVRDGGIATLGIVPTRPETGYGYIAAAGGMEGPGDCRRVERFIEKPDAKRALTYLRSGTHYWNAGVFVATPEVLLREIRTHLPALSEGLLCIGEALSTGDAEEALARVYPGLPNISFDYGIMERTREPVFVVPVACGWSDVGSWRSLYELRQDAYDPDGNCVEGDAVLVGCRDSLVVSREKTVVCLGLKTALVVDTADTVLVADLDRSQDIRSIVETLKDRGKERLL